MEARRAPVQRVRPVVLRERVLLPVERELALRDAVGVAADQAAEEVLRGHVAGEVLVAEDHVRGLAGPVLREDRDDEAPLVRHRDGGSALALQREQEGLAGLGPAEGLLLDAGRGVCGHGGSSGGEEDGGGGDDSERGARDHRGSSSARV